MAALGMLSTSVLSGCGASPTAEVHNPLVACDLLSRTDASRVLGVPVVNLSGVHSFGACTYAVSRRQSAEGVRLVLLLHCFTARVVEVDGTKGWLSDIAGALDQPVLSAGRAGYCLNISAFNVANPASIVMTVGEIAVGRIPLAPVRGVPQA
jgi:hypothetical protein